MAAQDFFPEWKAFLGEGESKPARHVAKRSGEVQRYDRSKIEAAVAKAYAAVAAQPEQAEPKPKVSLAKAVRDLQQVSDTFNTRLSFSLNEKLDQVVVKVIENGTDKIVREIPPSELQHVYERIREVIGLLFDESA